MNFWVKLVPLSCSHPTQCCSANNLFYHSHICHWFFFGWGRGVGAKCTLDKVYLKPMPHAAFLCLYSGGTLEFGRAYLFMAAHVQSFWAIFVNLCRFIETHSSVLGCDQESVFSTGLCDSACLNSLLCSCFGVVPICRPHHPAGPGSQQAPSC